MKPHKNIMFLSLFLMLVGPAILQADSLTVTETPPREMLGLKITGFVEFSSLEMAGAQAGDIMTHYNGVKLESIEQLLALRDQVEPADIEVVLKRGSEDIRVTVPKGQLGVYLKALAADHQIDNDAKIIEGLGHLDWGIGMENSFLGCVTLLEEKYGSKLSYPDLLGLSGYGFRFHFFDGYCPSSPDATCGRDLGGEILKKLGYVYERFTLPDTSQMSRDEITQAKEKLLNEIKANVDLGWPVIAIDLIDVAEWGLVTGYQKNGTELFCRTYFDLTDRYEIAQKSPWVIYAIKGKKEMDLKDEYWKSLILAKELYNEKKYGSYANGINGIKVWLKNLKDGKLYKQMNDKKLYDAMHANWWIYYSLADARTLVNKYLTANQEKFGVKGETIEKLAKLMEQESALLWNNFNAIPSSFSNQDALAWTAGSRADQAKVLAEFLALEEQANRILKKEIK